MSLSLAARRAAPLLGRRAFSTAKPAPAPGLKNVVLVDGCRTPFQPACTAYNDLMAYDLARLALRGLMTKTGVSPDSVDYVFMGTVLQEVRTSNIARDAALGAGLPKSIPAHTVTQACISANQAICAGIQHIQTGQSDVVIAGGVETFSDVPIRFSRALRKRFLAMNKAKGTQKKLGILFGGLKMGDIAPEAPAIANFSTGEVMGHNTDRLCDRFGVSRQAQDEFAARSHQNGAKAHADGIYDDEIFAYNGSTAEEGIRGDSTPESMAKLKPAFVKPHGTVTAANASFLTDGAAATLLMSEEKALELGFKPKAYLRDWTFVSCDPFEDLLLGPTYATARVLQKAGLSLKDLDVIEFHEAFAGQARATPRAPPPHRHTSPASTAAAAAAPPLTPPRRRHTDPLEPDGARLGQVLRRQPLAAEGGRRADGEVQHPRRLALDRPPVRRHRRAADHHHRQPPSARGRPVRPRRRLRRRRPRPRVHRRGVPAVSGRYTAGERERRGAGPRAGGLCCGERVWRGVSEHHSRDDSSLPLTR